MQEAQSYAQRSGSEGPDGEVLATVATRFYLEGLTQSQIARQMGLDPSTISRYLKRAREEGVVRIEILPHRPPNVELGRKLCSCFGLRRAVVAPVGEDMEQTVAATAADFIGGLLRNGLRLGVSWGHTVAAVVHKLKPGTVCGLEVAQLAGSLSGGAAGIQGHEIVRQVVSLFPGSRAYYLNAPMIVDSAIIRDVMLSDRSIQGSLAAAARCEVALVGIGSVGPEATLVRYDHLLPEDYQRLLTGGVVASVNARFVNAAGLPVEDLDKRTIAIQWAELAAIPMVIAVAHGPQKRAAIAAALRANCIDVLVTDELTASLLIEKG